MTDASPADRGTTASPPGAATTASDAPSGTVPVPWAPDGSGRSASAPITSPAIAAGPPAPRRRSRWRAVVLALVVLLLLGALAAAVHLYRTTTAWQTRAADYERAAEELGATLATTQADLEGARAELEGVRTQLATANERIVQLADEKAQLGDDREVQRQLVDYQQRVSEAAGTVALALDQCVQGQDLLIGYLANAAQYDPVELERFGDDVQTLCQQATDANAQLQQELSQ